MISPHTPAEIRIEEIRQLSNVIQGLRNLTTQLNLMNGYESVKAVYKRDLSDFERRIAVLIHAPVEISFDSLEGQW